MTNSPLVSVLITAYNREQYIGEAIESVLASTYSNFELIIVDDCSIDNTVTIAREYEKNDARIRVHSNKQNLGQFPNRNKAALLARGKYLKYVDSDDLIRSHTLAVMVKGMEACEGVGIGVVYVNEEKKDKAAVPFKVINSRLSYLWHYFNGGLLFPGPTGCIYTRTHFLNSTGFPTDLGINGDIYVNLRIAAISNVVLFSPDLVHWRIHATQVDRLQEDYFNMHKERYLINRRILEADSVPINKTELKKIKFSNKILYIRGGITNLLFKREYKKFFSLLRSGNIPIYNLPLVLFPLRCINPFKKSLMCQ